MNIIKIIIFVGLLSTPLILTACHSPDTPSNDFSGDELKLVNNLNEYLKEQQYHYYCVKNGFTYTPNLSSSSSSSDLVWTGKCTSGSTGGKVPSSEDNAKTVRNELIERGLLAIDSTYANYISALYLGRSSANFIIDTLILATSGAISLLEGSSRTQQILGVTISTTQGIRSSFDTDFFDKQTTFILVNVMETNRKIQYEKILENKRKTTDEYSLIQAMRDLVIYYNAGTPLYSLNSLSQKTAAEAYNSTSNDFASAEASRNSIYADQRLMILQAQIKVDDLSVQKKLSSIINELSRDDSLAAIIKDEIRLNSKNSANPTSEELIKILQDIKKSTISQDLLNKINRIVINNN